MVRVTLHPAALLSRLALWTFEHLAPHTLKTQVDSETICPLQYVEDFPHTHRSIEAVSLPRDAETIK